MGVNMSAEGDWLALRSAGVAGRSGLAHSHDDHYRASFRRSGSAERDDPLAGASFWRQVTPTHRPFLQNIDPAGGPIGATKPPIFAVSKYLPDNISTYSWEHK